MMARRKISLGELAEKIDITPANLSILKTGKGESHSFFYVRRQSAGRWTANRGDMEHMWRERKMMIEGEVVIGHRQKKNKRANL